MRAGFADELENSGADLSFETEECGPFGVVDEFGDFTSPPNFENHVAPLVHPDGTANVYKGGQLVGFALNDGAKEAILRLMRIPS